MTGTFASRCRLRIFLLGVRRRPSVLFPASPGLGADAPPGTLLPESVMSRIALPACLCLGIALLVTPSNVPAQNPNCPEPVNFAFLQRNGVPSGPPGPATATNATFTPNKQTLLMTQGDHLRITIEETPAGLLTRMPAHSCPHKCPPLKRARARLATPPEWSSAIKTARATKLLGTNSSFRTPFQRTLHDLDVQAPRRWASQANYLLRRRPAVSGRRRVSLAAITFTGLTQLARRCHAMQCQTTPCDSFSRINGIARARHAGLRSCPKSRVQAIGPYSQVPDGTFPWGFVLFRP